jgi:organic hydroperoxide reductase OsmC/OhrA
MWVQFSAASCGCFLSTMKVCASADKVRAEYGADQQKVSGIDQEQ